MLLTLRIIRILSSEHVQTPHIIIGLHIILVQFESRLVNLLQLQERVACPVANLM